MVSPLNSTRKYKLSSEKEHNHAYRTERHQWSKILEGICKHGMVDMQEGDSVEEKQLLNYGPIP